MDNRGIQTRFAQWREQEGLTLREVQASVNDHLPETRQIKSSGTISNYEKKESDKPPPRADFLAALKAAYPTLNVEWMVTGRGEMYDVGDRELLRAELASEHETFARLPDAAQDLLMDTLTRWAAFAKRPSEGSEPWGEGRTVEAAGDLLFLLELPARSVREGRFETEEAWESYLLAVLQAIRLALPEPGDREAQVDLQDGLARMLRRVLE